MLSYAESIGDTQATKNVGVLADLGAAWRVGYDQDEVAGWLRVGRVGDQTALSFLGGFRSVFGAEAWKTFIDLSASLRVLPDWSIGPRVAVGVRYALGDSLEVLSGVGGQLGFGQFVGFDVEAFGGLSWRFDLSSP